MKALPDARRWSGPVPGKITLLHPHGGRLEFEAVAAVLVAAACAVAGSDGIQSCCAGGDVGQLAENLVALAQQLLGAAALGAGRVGGGHVVGGAVDGGAGLAILGVGDAELLGVRQVVGQDGEQRVVGLLFAGGWR